MSDNGKFLDIIRERDIDGLIALDRGGKEDFLFALIYDHLANMPLSEMNEAQKTLFLASRLEDTCQADALPSLSEDEELFLALSEIKRAYERLGADKTAALLEEFISLLPAGKALTVPEWDWFFENERNDIIKRIDGEIGDYPDGAMTEKYIDYISNRENASEILMNLNRKED